MTHTHWMIKCNELVDVSNTDTRHSAHLLHHSCSLCCVCTNHRGVPLLPQLTLAPHMGTSQEGKTQTQRVGEEKIRGRATTTLTTPEYTEKTQATAEATVLHWKGPWICSRGLKVKWADSISVKRLPAGVRRQWTEFAGHEWVVHDPPSAHEPEIETPNLKQH